MPGSPYKYSLHNLSIHGPRHRLSLFLTSGQFSLKGKTERTRTSRILHWHVFLIMHFTTRQYTLPSYRWYAGHIGRDGIGNPVLSDQIIGSTPIQWQRTNQPWFKRRKFHFVPAAANTSFVSISDGIILANSFTMRYLYPHEYFRLLWKLQLHECSTRGMFGCDYFGVSTRHRLFRTVPVSTPNVTFYYLFTVCFLSPSWCARENNQQKSPIKNQTGYC